MHPFVRSGDIVTLVPCGQLCELIAGETVFFRKNEQYCLHRVLKVNAESVLTRGDCTIGNDGYIPREDIVAKIKSVQRGGKNVYLDTKLRRYQGWIISRAGRAIYSWERLLRRTKDVGSIVFSWIQHYTWYRRPFRRLLSGSIDIVDVISSGLDGEVIASFYDLPKEYGQAGTAERCFVALRKKKLIGRVVCSQYRQTELWLIYGLAVRPLFRGSGTGKRLMKAAMEYASCSRAREIGLFVDTAAIPAIRLYEKMGFMRSEKYPDGFDRSSSTIYMARPVN